MALDGHIHIRELALDRRGLRAGLRRAGMEGGIVLSLPPPAFPAVAPSASPLARMDNVLRWCDGEGSLHPFYWIDPMEGDALEQVALAVKKGLAGFKVICDRYYPGDPRALEVFGAIAAVRKPVLFHSGILWDGKFSSRYNRPAEFEALLEVKGLRFSLAHMSWPWCDELIAVYGKFLNAQSSGSGSGVEMFIDTTPGTPAIYRRDALVKLLTVGYDVEHNVIFGSDSCANDYHADWVRQWIERDREIFEEIGLKESLIRAICGDNMRRFVAPGSGKVRRKALRPGE